MQIYRHCIRYIDWCEVQKQPTCLLYFTCLYPRILTSSYPQICTHLLVFSHPYILISSSSYAHAYIPASSYPQVRVCLLVSLHPHILISSGLCVLACILVSSRPHIHRFMCTCWYPHILISSGLCVLASMLTSSGQCVLNTNE